MTTVITGMNGFAGTWLASLVRDRGDEPIPIDLPETDLTDFEQVDRLISKVRPDRVYHLAAQSSEGEAWKDPEKTFAVNLGGTRNLLEALVAHSPSARVLFVSSGAVYGSPRPDRRPYKEEDVPLPASLYAVSKLAAEIQCEMFYHYHGLDVRRVRPQGHIGPGQGLGFVAPDFASQAAAIALGQKEPRINVGNLGAAREFADVRDVARAYFTIMENGEAGGLYNLATNDPHTVGDVLATLIKLAEIEAEIVQDDAKLRPTDVSSPMLDTEKINALGFEFEIPFEQTMADLLKEWTEKLRNNA